MTTPEGPPRSSRPIAEREYGHERMADQFLASLSAYDTRWRVAVLVDEFFPDPDALRGKKTIDVGCGLGFFSERLHQRGADVTAVDLGPTLVMRTRERVGCNGQVADALALSEHFGRESFDVVVSSECIEHTPDPQRAVREMAAVLRPGGWLSLSTPNLLWSPVVRLASRLKLRRFDAYENFSTWGGLERTLTGAGLRVEQRRGLHLIPFQLGLHRLSSWLDRHAQPARALMINICVLARKPGA